MKTAVVVGGGVAGILSALLLKREYKQVYLIEKQNQLGGLLNSVQNEYGLWFDYGTHFLRETGNSDLDGILLKNVSEKNCYILNYLKTGNYFQSKLNDQSPFPDLRLLPEPVYHQSIFDLLMANGEGKENLFGSLGEQLQACYGKTVTEHFYRPVLKRFYGFDLSELSVNAHHLFGLTRFLAFDVHTTNELKKSSIFDQKIAAHHYSERQSGLRNFYPKQSGIGDWVKLLNQQLAEEKITVLTNQTIQKIHVQNDSVQTVFVDRHAIDCDFLVWTLPLPLFLKTASIENYPIPKLPPRLKTRIYNFVFDKPFLTDLYYICCYDPGFLTYRITLYSNIPFSSQRKYYHLTVESLLKEGETGAPSAEVVRELIRMGVVSAGSSPLSHTESVVSEGFPVLLNSFVADSKRLLETMQKKFKNSIFLGKGVGVNFFMNDVLIDVYQTLVGKKESVVLNY